MRAQMSRVEPPKFGGGFGNEDEGNLPPVFSTGGEF